MGGKKTHPTAEWNNNTKRSELEGGGKKKSRSPNINSIPSGGGKKKKKLFVGEFCYSHYSIPLLFSSSAASRSGFVGSKLFSESGERRNGTLRRLLLYTFLLLLR